MYLGEIGVDHSNDLYGPALESAAPGISDAIVTAAAPGESWIDTLARLLPTLVVADSQRRLLAVQLDRAAKGLPPLDSTQYGMGVNMGLSPELLRVLMVLGGALLVLAVIVAWRRK